MFCKNCGKEIPEGAQFCAACGTGQNGSMAAQAGMAGGLSVEDQKYVDGWSWGGFFATWIYLFVYKQKKLGWMIFTLVLVIFILGWASLFMTGKNTLPLSYISLPLGLARLVISIWIGVRGREIVWKSGKFASVAEMKKKKGRFVTFAVIYILFSIISTAVVGVASLAKGVALRSQMMQQENAQPQTTSTGDTSATPNTDTATSSPSMDQQMQAMAFAHAQQSDPKLDKAVFDSGYAVGAVDGAQSAPKAPSSLTSQSDSYQAGYGSGFVIACMEKFNDKDICTSHLMSALGMSKPQ